MATKLNGRITLSKIPKDKVLRNEKGEAYIYVDIVPNKNGADQYGNTHSVQFYNKDTKETIYLGNLKSVEFGTQGAPAPSAPTEGNDGLPF